MITTCKYKTLIQSFLRAHWMRGKVHPEAVQGLLIELDTATQPCSQSVPVTDC